MRQIDYHSDGIKNETKINNYILKLYSTQVK